MIDEYIGTLTVNNECCESLQMSSSLYSCPAKVTRKMSRVTDLQLVYSQTEVCRVDGHAGSAPRYYSCTVLHVDLTDMQDVFKPGPAPAGVGVMWGTG